MTDDRAHATDPHPTLTHGSEDEIHEYPRQTFRRVARTLHDRADASARFGKTELYRLARELDDAANELADFGYRERGHYEISG